MVEAETKRRTAEQLGRDHVQMYGVPQLAENVEFLRASGEQLRQMRRVVAPLARTLATRLAARRRRSRAGEIDLRKTLPLDRSTPATVALNARDLYFPDGDVGLEFEPNDGDLYYAASDVTLER